MKRKVLPGVRNSVGQTVRVTIGATGVKEARIIDPVGPLTIPGGHTPESKAAMSEKHSQAKERRN
ncbi:hypothetical protein [Paenibacillus thiaminolyticus]|uniref:hypothetical protein n=1 Tax=Paenibacillus thiaminolyticus TaxID=49283 RepID=UPI0011C42C15|nr:hypothetical protein [Paenibacillus thiaminolyticus]